MNTLRRHRLPVDIISYALEVYCRLKPSHRDVENLLAKRGIIDIGGAIRLWCIKFSSVSLRRLKRSYGRVCRTERLSPKPNHLKRKTPAVGEGLSFGRTRRMVSSALASRTLTPSGRLWRPKRSCGRILSNHAVLTQTYSSKTKKPRYREALFVLVGPGGFEPPTSTMSRLSGLTETR